MSDPIQNSSNSEHEAGEGKVSTPDDDRRYGLAIRSLILLLVFGMGVGSGYLMGRNSVHAVAATSTADSHTSEGGTMSIMSEVNPPQGYTIPAVFGDVGPQLVAAGAIDLTRFISLYQQQNQPLTDEQMTLLTSGSDGKIVIKPDNAYFLLNFLWALGLTNDNPILTEGPMMSGGAEQVGGFASTGGWTIGAKEPTKLYASTKIISLTEEQQARLLEVASAVYRPCCNNPTHFPDCNHGMAMLGLLELMASQNSTTEEMYETAKYVTAFWYPQQMLEIATAFNALKSVNFAEADAKNVVSSQFASGTGFKAVHQWLSENGLLQQAPSSGGSCGVR